MIRNYFIVALRNLKRNPVFSIINIFGLTLGLAITSLVAIYVLNELTYDSFHRDSRQIYRLHQTIEIGGARMMGPQVSALLGPYLVEHYPNVLAQARISDEKKQAFRVGNKFFEENMIFADSSFFRIFTVRFVSGNPETALVEPFSLVLTKQLAYKFFGNENPIGKIIETEDNRKYKVTAVVESLPENSHLKFDMLGSFTTQYKLTDGMNNIDGWGMEFSTYTTYIKLSKGFTQEDMEAEFPGIVETYLSFDPNLNSTLSLQPIEKIYLYFGGGGDISRIILFSVVGIFVLLIACINYVNLNMADSIKRLKEIGVRKVVGAGRKQLMRQLLFESIGFSLISIVMALTLAELLLPFFNSVLQKNLSFDYIANWPLTLSFLLLAIITGVLAGLYPAWYLSAIRPVSALKGKFVFGSPQAVFRNVLVVVQFAISIFLMSCTGIIYMQTWYVNKTDLGFCKDNILVLNLDMKNHNTSTIRITDDIGNVVRHVSNKLAGIPEISGISVASGFPFGNTMIRRYYVDEMNKDKVLASCFVDASYIDLLKLKIINGRGFSDINGTEENNVIINETFAREMNWSNPIGKTLKSNDDSPKEYKVIGVVKDYHSRPFHKRILPTILLYTNEYNYFGSVGLKINSQDIRGVTEKIEDACKDIDMNWEAHISFLDQVVEAKYMEEYRTGRIFTNFALLAIVIASMGLYGLALFVGRQKRKEIGVRKVFGAGVREIILALSGNFIRLIVISAVVAIPLAWIYTDHWLRAFVYRVGNRWVVFVLAMGIAVAISFVTVFYQSFKSARANPIDALKYE